MVLLLKNLYYLKPNGVATKGDVLVEGEKIKQIGTGLIAEDCEVHDFHGNSAILPAFFNAHGHAAMTLLRGLGEEKPLRRWLDEDIFPYEAHLTADSVYAGTGLAFMEFALGGTAGSADMYYFNEAAFDVVESYGMKCGRGVGTENLGEVSFTSPRQTLSADPHAHYSLTLGGMKETAQEAKKYGLGLQTHFLEAPWERETMQQRFGLTPLKYLEQTGILELPYVALAHCVYLEPHEAKELAALGNVFMTHNPASNLKLGSGLPNPWRMMAEGLPVAIGTDGPASNNKLDMWSETRLAALLSKGVNSDPEAMPAMTALYMATEGAYRALGFANCGRLQEGWQADLQIVDISGPSMVGVDEMSLANFLVYSGERSMVTDLLVNGHWVVKDKTFLPRKASEVQRDALGARQALVRRALGQ